MPSLSSSATIISYSAGIIPCSVLFSLDDVPFFRGVFVQAHCIDCIDCLLTVNPSMPYDEQGVI